MGGGGASGLEHGCLRRVVVTYNAFFWVTGPGMIGLGIWVLIALGEYEPLVTGSQFSLPAFLLISAGGASVLAGLFGCLGSLNENKRLLVMYSVLMVLVCAAEITAAVFSFLFHDTAEKDVYGLLNDTTTRYNPHADHMDAWDSIHNKLSCCGINNYRDWQITPSLQSSHAYKVTPLSCCKLPRNVTSCNLGNDDGEPLYPELIFQKGCGPLLVQWLRNIYVISGWTAAGVATSMILALSAICCLKHALSV